MESVGTAEANRPLLPAWQRTKDQQSARMSNGTAILNRSLSHIQLPPGQTPFSGSGSSARYGHGYATLHSHGDKAASAKSPFRPQPTSRIGLPSTSLPPSEHDDQASRQNTKEGADTWFIKQQQYEALIEELHSALKVQSIKKKKILKIILYASSYPLIVFVVG